MKQRTGIKRWRLLTRNFSSYIYISKSMRQTKHQQDFYTSGNSLWSFRSVHGTWQENLECILKKKVCHKLYKCIGRLMNFDKETWSEILMKRSNFHKKFKLWVLSWMMTRTVNTFWNQILYEQTLLLQLLRKPNFLDIGKETEVRVNKICKTNTLYLELQKKMGSF